MDYRPRFCLPYRATPVPRPQNRRKEIRTSLLLLLLRHTDRRTTGPLHILRLGLLPGPFPRDDSPHKNPAGRQLENDGLHRPCQPRRHAGPDYRPLDVLPQDEDALHGRARHDSRCHSHHRLLHPPCQPDELRNHRQTDRRALGIHLRARRHAAPPSGTALRSHRLLHLLLRDGLAIQTRTEKTRNQT